MRIPSFVYLFSLLLLLPLFFAPAAWAARVLYIGDSHSYLGSLTARPDVHRLGHVIIDGMRAKEHELDYYAACGSRPASWTAGGTTSCGYSAFVGGTFQAERSSSFPRVATLNPKRYNQLVVVLGDNMFRWKKSGNIAVSSFNLESFRAEMDAFFKELGSTTEKSCAWVGPTYHIEGSSYRKTNESVDQLVAALGAFLKGKCRLIDSRPLVVTSIPNDGLHHVGKDSAAWGAAILKKLGD